MTDQVLELEVLAASRLGEKVKTLARRLHVSIDAISRVRKKLGLVRTKFTAADDAEESASVERCKVCHLALPHFECIRGDALARRDV
jgi:Zn-dependent peptidase ImmA (M78 family)